jgi:hypothetical protein
MKGYQFRRQRPVLNYIADFMCKDLKLIIEVDGITHHYPDTQLNDRIKQKALEKAGFTVLKFQDEDVLMAIDWVTSEIEEWIVTSGIITPPLPIAIGAPARCRQSFHGLRQVPPQSSFGARLRLRPTADRPAGDIETHLITKSINKTWIVLK